MALCFHVFFLFVQAASHAENKNVLEIDDLSEILREMSSVGTACTKSNFFYLKQLDLRQCLTFLREKNVFSRTVHLYVHCIHIYLYIIH